MATILPILKLRSTLITSVHRHLEDDEVLRFQEELLATLGRAEARHVIVDISSMEIIDTFMSRQLSQLARCCIMMGARVILAGLQPEVATTMVEMRHSVSAVQCAVDFEHAFELVERDDPQRVPSRTEGKDL